MRCGVQMYKEISGDTTSFTTGPSPMRGRHRPIQNEPDIPAKHSCYISCKPVPFSGSKAVIRPIATSR
ncbi:protein of unknown function (plasmid) [Cupriavidus taiwanensis]|uniref:Uncharacterized protein n=1 Tax=Cupriavidus taiwanensis TaxID=164546 RepID=A0A375HBB5_9BURK|nr:protein of unknown function [Cupriavidus taiwanensis]SOZ72446.1 protein of unknown function [Cupriavidus taiwanensis]SOZ74847.1 protein of unknown function [Cupriavidus taiwanensis]SPA03649.1 protein of unknown function [Cupriavidus taiwanensis]SPA11546.1 protein of unknown function [Cupriavidus taiwanensis]